jgi:prepilin-type N-terminal cleavage/methylation domain-containing protein
MRENRQFINDKGFTLIEIAIVLVIIGLIIGAVVKGKDLIQSGKQKKFYTTFLKTWELAVVNYYDRTGYLLGDGRANGGTAASTDGRFDNISGANFGSANGVNAKLQAVGLTVPTSNTANSGQFNFKGQYSGNRIITLYLYYLYSHTQRRRNNALYLRNIPTDLAIALDKMVDGQVDARAGTFRRYADNASPNNGTWPDASVTAVVNAQYIIDVP